MAQTSLWEALTASVASMDNQAVLAVQSLLESQNLTENASATSPVEEEDLFQCGKCKKTYTSLPNFITHKQKCSGTLGAPRATTQQIGSNSSSAFTTNVQVINRQVPTYNTVPASPLTQTIGPGMVLTDDLMTLTNIDPTIQTSTLQVGTAIQGNPFLTQLAPLTPRAQTTSTTTVYSTTTTPTFTSNQSAFTTLGGQIQIQTASPGGQEQQVIIAQAAPVTTPTVTEQKADNQPIPDPSPIKMESAQMFNSGKRRSTKILDNLDMEPVMVVKKKLKCQYCDKAFTKNFDLQQHIRSHTGEKPFQCIVCGRAFAQKSNVKKHMQTHKVWPSGTSNTLPKQSGPTVIVEEEEEKAAGQAQINQEVTQTDTAGVRLEEQPNKEESSATSPSKQTKATVQIVVDSSYLCQYCNEKFKSYFALKSHMVQHKDEQVYKCVMKTCSMTFRELDDFLEHVKAHETDMSYRCHMCNKQFPSLYELGVHQYSHSLYPNQGPRPGPKYYRCTKCLNKYATPEALDHHMQTTTHNYPCPHCEKVFPCERYLRRHLPIHGDSMDYKCETCGKEFKTDHSLKMHVIIHSGQKPFKCERCQAAFNRKDKLKRHLLIHDPVRKYKCPFRNHTGCMKEFNRPDKLKAHIISHSGIKPHQCNQCNKSFMRKVQLMEHETTHHTHEFKFTCIKCNKGFTKEKQFKDHRCDRRVTESHSTVNSIKKGESTLLKPASRRKVGRPKKRNNVESPEMTKEQITLTVMRQKSRRRRVQLQQESLKEHIKNEKPTVDVTSGDIPYKVTPVEVITDASGAVASEVGKTTDITEYNNVTNTDQKLPTNQLPGIHTIAEIAQLQSAGSIPMHTVVLNSSEAASGFATVTITDIHGQSHEASVALAEYTSPEHATMAAEYTTDASGETNAAAIFNASLVPSVSAANLNNIPNQTIIASVSSNGTLVVHNSAAELLQNTPQQQQVTTESAETPSYVASSTEAYHTGQVDTVYAPGQNVAYSEPVQSDAVYQASQASSYENAQSDIIYPSSDSTYVTQQTTDVTYATPQTVDAAYVKQQSVEATYATPQSTDSTYVTPQSTDATFITSQSTDTAYVSSQSADVTYVTQQAAETAVYQSAQGDVSYQLQQSEAPYQQSQAYQAAMTEVVYNSEQGDGTYESKMETDYSGDQPDVTYPSSQPEAELPNN